MRQIRVSKPTRSEGHHAPHHYTAHPQPDGIHAGATGEPIPTSTGSRAQRHGRLDLEQGRKTLADTFRESPWTAHTNSFPLATVLSAHGVRFGVCVGCGARGLLEHRRQSDGQEPSTRHLEGVDWHHDHTASRPGHQVYKNGMVFLLLRLHVGPFSFTVDMRLYLREKTVRRLNRGRPVSFFVGQMPMNMTGGLKRACPRPAWH